MAEQQEQISIDLAKASNEDLLNMRNEILKRLAERAKTSNLMADYDRHGSGHSRSTPPKMMETGLSSAG